MKQSFDTGSPYLNMLNGLDESLKSATSEEMLEELQGVDVKTEGLAILKSAMEEAKKRKAIAKAKSDLEEDRYSNRPRQ